eukprot:6480702-Prymnesium_polylepis.1
MDDWQQFVSVSTGASTDVALERDAEALIERLEAFGSRVSSMDLSPRRPSVGGASPAQREPPADEPSPAASLLSR